MSTKQAETKIEELIADTLSAMGYDLVRVKLMSGGSFITLQLMAERADGKPMTVQDCVHISHAVSPKLDADETMADRYTLEVSSPGIDRPLVRLKDFERFAGHVARIDLETPLDGPQGSRQRRFQGNIIRVSGREPNAEIELRTENGDVHLPVSNIARANLVASGAKPPGQRSGAKH
jgi:ribosome maturation factor RimP